MTVAFHWEQANIYLIFLSPSWQCCLSKEHTDCLSSAPVPWCPTFSDKLHLQREEVDAKQAYLTPVLLIAAVFKERLVLSLGISLSVWVVTVACRSSNLKKEKSQVWFDVTFSTLTHAPVKVAKIWAELESGGRLSQHFTWHNPAFPGVSLHCTTIRKYPKCEDILRNSKILQLNWIQFTLKWSPHFVYWANWLFITM